MKVWSKKLPARHKNHVKIEVDDESGISIHVEDDDSGLPVAFLTHNQASDLAHELLEAIRQHQNAQEVGGEG